MIEKSISLGFSNNFGVTQLSSNKKQDLKELPSNNNIKVITSQLQSPEQSFDSHNETNELEHSVEEFNIYQPSFDSEIITDDSFIELELLKSRSIKYQSNSGKLIKKGDSIKVDLKKPDINPNPIKLKSKKKVKSMITAVELPNFALLNKKNKLKMKTTRLISGHETQRTKNETIIKHNKLISNIVKRV